MEMVLIKRDSAEWQYMWNWLAAHPRNVGLPDPIVAANNGEAWQYVGSFKQDKKVVHEFRHRSFPQDNQVLYLKVSSSPTFSDKDIQKTIPIK